MNRRIFPGVGPAKTDFQAVRDGRRSRPLYFEISLASARSIANGITTDATDVSGKALQLTAAGNIFYCDPIYDLSGGGTFIAGVAVAHFEDSALGQGVSTPVTLLPNSAQAIPFTTVIIENAAQAGKKLRVIYGVDIDFTPGFNAQLLGSVALDAPTLRSIRFSDAISAAGEAFLGYGAVNAVAAQLGHVQLFNGGTGFAYVDGLKLVNPGGLSTYSFCYHNTALTLSSTPANRDAGSAAAASTIRTTTNAARQGTFAFTFTAPTAQDTYVKFDPPMRLGPNEGVLVANDNVNQGVAVYWDLRERTV